MEQQENWSLIEEIEQDMRDRMNEPDHYGLKAIELAELWFDSQSALVPPGFNVILRYPEKPSPVMLSCKEVEGRLEYLLKNGKSLLIDEDWDLIAVQDHI